MYNYISCCSTLYVVVVVVVVFAVVTVVASNCQMEEETDGTNTPYFNLAVLSCYSNGKRAKGDNLVHFCKA